MSDLKTGQKPPDTATGCEPAHSEAPAHPPVKKSGTCTPVASSPCLLDEDEDFNPDYLPDYSKSTK